MIETTNLLDLQNWNKMYSWFLGCDPAWVFSHRVPEVYETSTWVRQWSVQLDTIHLSICSFFMPARECFEIWHRLRLSFFFFWQAAELLIFQMCHTVRPFILNLNLYPFTPRSWRLRLDWNDTFTTTMSVAGRWLRQGWQCEGLIYYDCRGNTRRLFHYPSKQKEEMEENLLSLAHLWL